MQPWLIAIIVVAVVLTAAGASAIIWYYARNAGYVTRREIISKFNNTGYNTDGSPKGGILLSVVTETDVCIDYTVSAQNSASGEGCKTDISECNTNGAIINPGDINAWLTAVKQQGGGTNCFSLDTTYFRRDMPQFVFGPYVSDSTYKLDMTIGIMLDPTILFDYVACMFPADAGSVARYNPECVGSFVDMSNITESDKVSTWKNYLKTSDSRTLGSAGCGAIEDGRGLLEVDSASDYFMWNDNWAKSQLETIKNLSETDIIDGNWTISDNNKPFDKYQWENWAESTKNLYDKLASYGIKYLNNQFVGNDGYRENEVDIYVPNNSGVDCTDVDQGVCDVTEEFKQVFAKALLGVISVAEDNSTTNSTTQSYGPGGYGCVDGKTCQNTGLEGDCGSGGKYDVNSCITNEGNNCCYNEDTGKCYQAQDTDTVCCATVEFSQSIAKKLADTWNKSDYRTQYNGKKIRAYKMRVQNIYNFDYTLGEEKNLNLQEI